MFEINFNTDNRKNIFKKVPKDERRINYNNLFFKTGNSIIRNFDFFKIFGSLYDLFIDLLNEKNTLKATKEQNKMMKKIEELKDFILLEEKGITNKNTQSIIKKARTKT